MSELLGVAVLGAGHMGADHIRRVDQVVSGARVAAVADPDAERAKEAVGGIGGTGRITVHTDVEAALDAPGVEAVLIASPGEAHEEALLAAFARGCRCCARSRWRQTPRARCAWWRPRHASAGGWRRSGSCGGTTPSTGS